MSMLPLFPRVMVEKKENKNTHFWCCCVWLRDVVEHARVCASTVDRSKQHFALLPARSSDTAEPARSAGGVLARPMRSAAGSSWLALALRWHQRGAVIGALRVL